MIAGLSVIFGWSSVFVLLYPFAELSGSVLRPLDVLAVAVAVAVVLAHIRGTAGGRVAALVAAGLLPGLVGDFSFAGNQTAYMVSLLSSLLVAVLVWPVSITSWKGRARRTHQA